MDFSDKNYWFISLKILKLIVYTGTKKEKLVLLLLFLLYRYFFVITRMVAFAGYYGFGITN